ncbi:hypothetical protein OK074_3466 [Actinobacteria bacterium OK074]|nr:hypothetical protein OK074_3466 [Actinobacteria bacterium OK074]
MTVTAYEPKLGDTVEDTARRKTGKVMGFIGPYVQLRPVGGGIEWDARRENLRSATDAEALRAGVTAANERSRGAAVTTRASLPMDVTTMRETTSRLLADDAELPAADKLNDLILLCRGHLMLLIPEVEQAALRLPQDDRHRIEALTGIAQARRRLDLVPDARLPAEVAHAKRLAHSVDCLLRYLENLGGERP